jgi:hypothetical protein
MTTERPTTPRAALTALADAIELDQCATWLPKASVVEVLRREAGTYPDEPEGEAPSLRVEALHAASHWLIGRDDEDDQGARVIAAARAFEAYLRGTE